MPKWYEFLAIIASTNIMKPVLNCLINNAFKMCLRMPLKAALLLRRIFAGFSQLVAGND